MSDQEIREGAEDDAEGQVRRNGLGDDDTEGQGYRWSDEKLKQEIKPVAGALVSLKAIRINPKG